MSSAESNNTIAKDKKLNHGVLPTNYSNIFYALNLLLHVGDDSFLEEGYITEYTLEFVHVGL